MANTITVDVRALTGTFVTDIGKAEKAAQRAFRSIESQAKNLGIAVGAAFATAATALVALTKNSITTAASLLEMSQKLGVSVEKLSTLKFAAEQSGLSVQQLQAAMVKLAKNASEAAQGTGAAVNGFNALGISVKNADGSLKQTDVLLKEIATQLDKYRDGSNKTALAVNLLGRAGAELLPMLKGGATAIEELEQRARDLGLEISTQTAKQAEALGDQIDQLRLLATGFGNDIAKEVLPSLLGFTTAMVDAGVQSRKSGGEFSGLKVVIDVLLIGFIKMMEVTQNVGAGFAFFVDVLGKVTDAVKASSGVLFSYVQALKDALSGDLTGAAANFEQALQKATNVGAEFGKQIRQSAATLAGSFDANAKEAERKISAMASASAMLNKEIKETDEASKEAAPAIEDMAKAAAAAAKAERARAQELRKLLAEQKKLEDQYDRELMRAEELRIETERLAREQQQRFDESAKGIQDEIKILSLSAPARQQMLISLEAERLARDENGNVVKKQVELYKKLLTELAKTKHIDDLVNKFSDLNDVGLHDLLNDVRTLQKELARISDKDLMGGAFDPERVREVQSAIGGARQEALLFATDAIGQGISSLQSMATEGSRAYKRLEAAQAALNLVTAIGAIANQGMGDPWTAFARIAAMAAIMSKLVGSLSAGGFSNTASRRQETQGTGTVLGDMTAKSESIANAVEITADATKELVGINRGMLTALRAMQAGIGGASNRLAQGAGNVAFSPLPVPRDLSRGSIGARLGLPSFINSLLGGSSEITDQGILIMGGALSDMIEGISVGAFQEVQSRSWRFGSRRTREEVRALSDDVAAQFQLVLDSMADAVREGARALGLNMEEVNAAIAAFEIEEIRISTMDLSAEEAQAELEAAFSAIFDGLAGSIVPFIDQFQQVGEGLGETLVRVATEVQVTQEAIRQLGFVIEDGLGPEAMAQVSDALIQAAGGVEAFIDGMNTFMDAFAPESHRFAVAQDEITRAFEQAGLTLPATRDGMFALMQSLDAGTESGREQIATLLRLASVADDYYSGLEDQAEAAAEALALAAEAEQARLEAMLDYAAAVADIDRQLAELQGASAFQLSLQDIAAALNANVTRLNEAARAAGLQGAREEDLGRAHLLAAAQAAQAMAQLEEAGRALAAELYGSDLADIEAEIARIQAETSGASSSLANFGDAMSQVAEAANRATDLLLGNLSPLRDREKLPIALEAFRRGEIQGEQVLEIGRRLFASGADYNRLFNQVLEIERSRRAVTGGNLGGGGSVSRQSEELLALMAQRDEIQAAQNQAQRFTQATELAQIVADLAGFRGEDFGTILEQLTGGRATLEQFAEDLGLTGVGALNDYLTALQADSYSLEELALTITAGEQLIVDTLRDLFSANQAPKPGVFVETSPLLTKPVLDVVPGPAEEVPAEPTPGEQIIGDGIIGLGDEIITTRDVLSQLLEIIANNTHRGNKSAESAIAELRSREAASMPRSSRSALTKPLAY